MKIDRRRTLALFLVLSLFFSLWPSAGFHTPARAESLGIVTSSSVHVRKQSSRYAEIWFDLSQNAVCTILGETDAENIHWYKVETTHPESRPGSVSSTYIGFIHGDYFRPLTEEEIAARAQSTATPVVTAAPVISGVTVGVVTNGGTNFREGPSMKAHSMMKLDRGTKVEILSSPSVISSETFYEVKYAGLTGYIMSTFIRIDGSAVITAVPTATPTPAPGGVTPDPSATATPTPTSGPSAYTHVRLILSSCHLRTAPGGSYDSENDWEGRGKTLPLAGDPVRQGGYTWYPVWVGNVVYYVRNDCVQPYTDAIATAVPTMTPAPTAGPTAVPTATPVPTPTPTSAVNALGYVITTKGGCNLRSSIGGTVIKQIKRNVTLPYLLPPVTKDGYTWYYVDADGNRGYLRGDVVKVVNAATPTPTTVPTATDGTPITAVPTATDNPTGYVKTNAGGVNLRKNAGYTDVLGQVDRGVVMPYYNEPTTVKGVIWYYVRHPSLGYGWLHGSYLVLVNADGTSLPTATPIAVNTVTATGGSSSSSSKQEASYTTLKLGSTGASVRNLIQELKNQGYYNGSVSTRYTSAVERAVEAFQRAKGLTVDGVAGSATQHALYGTVPIGSADTTNLTMTIYPAEKIDWYTGGINELWPRGSNYKVYDVKTGIVWWAHRWAGSKHVDAEPLTAADTARICKIYGVSTAQEIADRDLYQRRPMLVTIGTRTFACSLYGEPHNEEGNTIKDNNFPGQLCIHFTNSRIHGSNKVDSGHQEAIEFAWENAPNGHI